MDKKAWWLRIKNNYPFALADCLQWFQKNSRDYWREDLQLTEKLLDYFECSYIVVDLRRLAKDSYWKYGYKVSDSSTTIIKDAIFDLPEAADHLSIPPTSWFTHLKVPQMQSPP